jgi:putative PIN family toxin of toxin-antitoxin system
VLDSNVWLDWLVFADPCTLPIANACAAGTIEIVIDADCRAEFVRVLGYPQFALDDARRSALLDRLDTLCVVIEVAADALLPSCRDPDDRKFLALAQSARAAWLLTRDNALLAVSRTWSRAHGLRIVTPVQWGHARCALPA